MPLSQSAEARLRQWRQSARILVADDDPVNLKLLQQMLRSAGYTDLELVDDARRIVPCYQARRADLVLLDLRMPHQDGFQVIAALEALHDPLRPPIVVITADGGREALLRALDLGARDFLRKPFDRLELLARVRNSLDAHYAHLLLHERKADLEKLVHERTEELRATRLQVVRRLGRAAEYRDNETGLHVLRMSHVSALIARSMGWSDAAVELLLHASPMHDIGKIGVPDSILLKPGRLDEQEWAVMQTHSRIGADILADGGSDLLEMARTIALGHHERWDGTGYPAGTAGEATPAAARIVAVADVFDALTSARAYKQAWPVDRALAYVREQAGRHFDPTVVQHFLARLPDILALMQRYAEPAEAP